MFTCARYLTINLVGVQRVLNFYVATNNLSGNYHLVIRSVNIKSVLSLMTLPWVLIAVGFFLENLVFFVFVYLCTFCMYVCTAYTIPSIFLAYTDQHVYVCISQYAEFCFIFYFSLIYKMGFSVICSNSGLMHTESP